METTPDIQISSLNVKQNANQESLKRERERKNEQERDKVKLTVNRVMPKLINKVL